MGDRVCGSPCSTRYIQVRGATKIVSGDKLVITQIIDPPDTTSQCEEQVPRKSLLLREFHPSKAKLIFPLCDWKYSRNPTLASSALSERRIAIVLRVGRWI